MKEKSDMRKIAIDNIDGDIHFLRFRHRIKKDTYLEKTVIMEKLALLYCMDIINSDTYYEYKETIKPL